MILEVFSNLNDTMILSCWAAELHHNRSLTPPPQKKRVRRKYAGKNKKRLTG